MLSASRLLLSRGNSPMCGQRVLLAPAASSASRTATGSSTSSSSAHYQAREAREKEEDKLLEEEEFNVMDEEKAVGGDEFMPLSHRLAAKADALVEETERIAWSLFGRRQLLMDVKPATFTGRPTQADKALSQMQHALEDAAKAGAHVEEHAQDDADGAEGRGRRGGSTSGATSKATAAAMWTAMSTAPYTHWHGSASPVVQMYKRVRRAERGSHGQAATDGTTSAAASTELATLSADLDYLRRGRKRHQLHYYQRINLTPKRHIWHALYHILWNLWIGGRNCVCAVVYSTFRGVRDATEKRGMTSTTAWLIGGPIGFVQGVRLGLWFIWYGWVLSPCLHLSRGLANTCYGPLNCVKGKYLFDALSGRWMRCAANDASAVFAHELQLEKRLIRTIGRAAYQRSKARHESKWGSRMASMGFSMQGVREKMQSKTRSGRAQQSHHKKEDARRRQGDGEVQDPYEVLGVRRTATPQRIKEQYKKLAKVFHPDVAASQHGGPLSAEEKENMQSKFADISNAYQVLSNPEKKKAYDMGGAQGLHMHETKYGTFLSRTPEEMVQSIFGGEAFRRLLIGELLRSHWDLKNEAQLSLSLQDFEELQCIRTRQLSGVLAHIVDTHAQKPTTGTYYRHVAGAGAARAAPHRAARLSGLPDPLVGRRGAAAARRTGAAAAASGRGAVLGGNADLHDAVLSELGEKPASGSTATRARPSPSSTPASVNGAPAEADAAALSPYTLHPGTNEFNCFSRDFEERCGLFAHKLSDACFGPELMYEVGEAYVIGAQRFLGVRPFYAPKLLVQRKIMSGMGRVWRAFVEQMKSPDGVDKNTATDELARKVMLEYFNMEFDNIVADMHVALRYTVQNVLQDVTVSQAVRRKRCYALWFLGEKMMEKGRPWANNRTKDDAELIAYIQQAANSASTTSRTITF